MKTHNQQLEIKLKEFDEVLELKKKHDKDFVESVEAEIYPIVSDKIINSITPDFDKKIKDLKESTVDINSYENEVREIKLIMEDNKD